MSTTADTATGSKPKSLFSGEKDDADHESTAGWHCAWAWESLDRRAAASAQDGPPVAKPTAEHKLLAKDVGTWDATVKSWMSGPDSEPTVSKGVEVDKLLPGGLWLTERFRRRVRRPGISWPRRDRIRHAKEEICRHMGRLAGHKHHDHGRRPTTQARTP